MKVFRNLEIKIPQSDVDDFIIRIDAMLSAGWQRDIDAEERSSEFGIVNGRYFMFKCNKTDSREHAGLAILFDPPDQLSVVNIVPLDKSELKYDEYNSILIDFYELFIKPVATELGIKVILSKDDETIDDWISEESAKRLRTFSGLANKSTGSSHPMDKNKWFDFIISMLNNGETIDTHHFQRWLVGEGWSADKALELAIEYEQGLSLLKYYRGQ